MNTATHVCSWCTPGKPGNHGICSRHAAEMVRDAQLDAAIENELATSALRVRRRFETWRLTDRMRNGRPLPVRWEPAGGKRWDQVVFSVGVALASIGIGLILAVLCAAWKFWR